MCMQRHYTILTPLKQLHADCVLHGAVNYVSNGVRTTFTLDIESNPAHALLFVKYARYIHEASTHES
jgi:hypothetical protein